MIDAIRAAVSRGLVVVLVAALRAYQLIVSPWLGLACRFEPSCSHYAMDAIARYGAVHGLWRGTRRLLRCHPFNPGGYDPVR